MMMMIKLRLLLRLRLPILLFLLLLVNGAANDECHEALEISSIPFSINGDTTNATVDFATGQDQVRNLTCGITTQGRGIWYKISLQGGNANDKFLQATVTPKVGGDDEVWKIKTALFATSSSSGGGATSGSSSGSASACIESLTCLSTHDYALLDSRTITTPVSQWYARSDYDYYFHVTGVTSQDIGEFQLDIIELNYNDNDDETAADGDTGKKNHDRCSTAIEVNLDGDGGIFTYSGTTVPSRPYTNLLTSVGDECSIRDGGSRGIFFTLTITGDDSDTANPKITPIQVVISNLLHDETLRVPDDDTDGQQEPGRFEVAKLLGDNCETCVTYNDFITSSNYDDIEDDNDDHTILFDVENNVKYTLFFAGESYSDVGTFTITIQKQKDVDKASGSGRATTVVGTTTTLILSVVTSTIIGSMLFLQLL